MNLAFQAASIRQAGNTPTLPTNKQRHACTIVTKLLLEKHKEFLSAVTGANYLDYLQDILIVAASKTGTTRTKHQHHSIHRSKWTKPLSRVKQTIKELRRKYGYSEKHTTSAARCYARMKHMQTEEEELAQKRCNMSRFRRDKFHCLKEVMDTIRGTEQRSEQEFTKEAAMAYLQAEYAAAPKTTCRQPQIPIRPQIAWSDITLEELQLSIRKKKKSSAAGKDLIQYGLLSIAITLVGEEITKAFNEVMTTGVFPKAWSLVRTIMAYKGGGKPKSELKSHRPISLTSCLGKLFHGIIATKLVPFLIQNGALDTVTQKGFVQSIQGCTEHISTLTNCLTTAARKLRNLFVAQFDLTAAFTSVPHEKLFLVLAKAGFPPIVISYIKKLYGNAKAHIVCKEGDTDNVRIERGVLQGDTLSPLLFLIYFSVTTNHIRKISKNQNFGFKIDSQLHNVKAYADDLTLVAPSLHQLQGMIAPLKKDLQWMQLEINPSKSRILQMTKGKLVKSPNFTVCEMQIPCSLEHGTKFLGCDLTIANNPPQARDHINAVVKRRMDVIDKSLYNFQAKCFFYQYAVGSMLRWLFSIYYNLGKTFVAKLTRLIGSYMKRWEKQPTRMNTDVYFSTKTLGVDDPRAIHREVLSTGLARGLRSSDMAVIQAARDRMTHVGKSGAAFKTLLAETEKLANEDGEEALTDKALFQKLQSLSRKDTHEQIKASNSRKECITFSTAILHEDIDEDLDKEFRKMMIALPETDLRWATSALVQALDCKAIQHREKRSPCPMCPLCKTEKQTLKHILSSCKVSLNNERFTVRHDAVLRCIAGKLQVADNRPKRLKDAVLWVDLPNFDSTLKPSWIGEGQGSLRPDIVMTDHESKEVWIYELTCPFDDDEGFRKAHSRKALKYEVIPELIAQSEGNFQVKVFTIEIGVRGRIAPTIHDLQQVLLKKPARELRREAAKTAIKWSHKIYRSRDTSEKWVTSITC